MPMMSPPKVYQVAQVSSDSSYTVKYDLATKV